MVIAPAKTGNESRSKVAVTKIAQGNIGIRIKIMPTTRILINVEMKFIAPIIEEAPAKCRAKIAKSRATPEWCSFVLKGG